MHDDCLVHEALLNTFKRLGRNKPHKPAPVKEEREDADGPKRPLSPSETGAAQTAQQSIDVKPEDQQLKSSVSEVANGVSKLKTEDTMTVSVASGTEKRGRPRRSEPNDPGTAKPYQGLFEAIVLNDVSPAVVKITDLREDVTGGEKEWSEPIKCLCCGEQIH